MNVLIIMHVESEGPGTLGAFLESQGARLNTARLYAGQPLPRNALDFDAIISMGGPMNVYEEDKYPFLRKEVDLLRRAVSERVPTLGICLGAQMIARASGAMVTRSPKKEVGWGKVLLTTKGKSDPVFRGLPPTLEVLQWHEDMFHIPERGTLLATSEDCPHQAFRIANAVGLQFHVEVTRGMIEDWFSCSPDLPAILKRFDALERNLNRHAGILYKNFVNLIC